MMNAVDIHNKLQEPKARFMAEVEALGLAEDDTACALLGFSLGLFVQYYNGDVNQAVEHAYTILDALAGDPSVTAAVANWNGSQH